VALLVRAMAVLGAGSCQSMPTEYQELA